MNGVYVRPPYNCDTESLILLDFVLDLAPNGDLQSRISRLGSISVDCTRFYMAQVIDGLQWMHSKGVLHR